MKKQLKKNKFLFLMPLACLPFIVVIFYVLGGGTAHQEELSNENRSSSGTGANYMIPEAEKSIEILDKLESYQEAGVGMVEIRIPDSSDILEDSSHVDLLNLTELAERNHELPVLLLEHIDRKEKEIRYELESKPVNSKRKVQTRQTQTNKKPESIEIKTLPEIKELERVFDRSRELEKMNDSLRFYLAQTQSRLQRLEDKKKRSFSLEKPAPSQFSGNKEGKALIKAEIFETSTVLDGNRVKLRLLEDALVNGKVVKANTFLYGICKTKNERLLIAVSQMPIRNGFIPVDLSIHDLDGLEGLYIPDNAARKVIKEVGASTNTSAMVGVSSDPLSYAGIRAADRTAQTMLKGLRIKKVTVKKNTLVYLINQNQ